jgi:hypothetical protein
MLMTALFACRRPGWSVLLEASEAYCLVLPLRPLLPCGGVCLALGICHVCVLSSSVGPLFIHLWHVAGEHCRAPGGGCAAGGQQWCHAQQASQGQGV